MFLFNMFSSLIDGPRCVYVRFLFWVNVQRNTTASTMDKPPLSLYIFHLIRLWCYGYGYGELEDLISCALYYMLLA